MFALSITALFSQGPGSARPGGACPRCAAGRAAYSPPNGPVGIRRHVQSCATLSRGSWLPLRYMAETSEVSRRLRYEHEASACWNFSRPLDRQHTIQVRLLGASPIGLGPMRTLFTSSPRRWRGRLRSRYSRVATSELRSGTSDRRGGTSVSRPTRSAMRRTRAGIRIAASAVSYTHLTLPTTPYV